MASQEELQNFLENLLTNYDPTIDLSPGSPAQSQLIDPVLSRFEEDPFSTDIPTFIRDRMVQEFPDLLADNGGELEDLLSSPLQLLLEPFKREIQTVKINQSTENANLMADAEADALGANFFEDRQAGGLSGTSVRLYFAAPTTANVTVDKKAYTNSGLNYFPVENFKITTSEMLFNRQGNLYYMDITVQAEQPGDEYNVDIGEIANIDDVPGVVKVSNLSKVSDGSPREDNETYLGRIPEALTERSLVTERGILARIPNLFTSVRALSIIGAGDAGMDRDIIKGTSQGFLHVAGTATYYGSWLIVTNIVYKDTGSDGDIVIQPGDTVRFEYTGSRVYEALVSEIIPATTIATSTQYILILDRTFSLPITTPQNGSFALFKPGFLTISEIPGGIAANVQVPDGTVHLGGHTDIFVRSNSDVEEQSPLSNLTDDEPVLAIPGNATINLRIDGSTGSPTNIIHGDTLNFATSGVQIGDLLVIETTALAGSYRILAVGDPSNDSLRLDTLFTQTVSQIRARVVRSIHIDLVEPKIPKLPFNTGSVSDLRTTVGSSLFRMDSTNIQSFGAVEGDILRVLDGPDAGDFVIQRFDGSLGGQGPIVDRLATASLANLRYEVFSALSGLQLPLVRIKTIEILDSTNQGTGITVPYGDAVDVRPTCNFDGATKEVRLLDRQMFIFPDGLGTLSGLSNAFGTSAGNHDTRYSQEIESFDGIVRNITTANGSNPIIQNEINLPPFLYNGVRNKLLAFTTRRDPNFTAYMGGDNRTSDVAEAKVGDSITILDGPNQGSYLITDLRVLDMWNIGSLGHSKVAIVEVDPPFPVDPVKTMMDFISAITPGGAITGTELLRALSYSTDFFNAGGFWNLLQSRLAAAMTAQGISIAGDALDALTRNLAFTGYSVGPSARGDVRIYFQEPVSAEFSFGDNPTRFVDLLQPSRVFRLDPQTEPAQILPESEVTTAPSEWNRNEGMEFYTNGDSPTDFLFVEDGTPFASRGILDGDLLQFYRAINDFPARAAMSSSFVCITQAGSNVITALLPRLPGHLTPIEPGQLFFIDSGPDIGAYTVTEVITDQLGTVDRPVVQFRIDKVMTHSTAGVPGNVDIVPTARPGIPSDFSTGQARTVSSQSRLYHQAMQNAVANSDWVSIYAVLNDDILEAGDDTAYLGTFKVIDLGAEAGPVYYVVLDRSPNFPDTPSSVDVFWVVHAAPTTSPADTTNGGKVLSDSFVRCRFYDAVLDVRTISIPWTSGAPLVPHTLNPETGTQQIELQEGALAVPSTFQDIDDQPFFSHRAPYRISRGGVHRISSTAMALQREGALYYVDLRLIGYGPSSQMNIPRDTALAIKENARIDGYTLLVENPIFTFSDQEKVSIILPSTVLPVGSTPGLDNEIGLAGQTVQVTYNSAPLVEELQRFVNSPLDRVVVANYLLRHFLPMYVFIDANYVGGSDTSIVATDLVKYVNTIPPAINQLRADQVQDTIKKRNASQVTLPITVLALVHDIDRKIRGIRSQNAIGAGDIPIFNGTYAQTYFIAGPDTSLVSPRPNGEQIFLVRT